MTDRHSWCPNISWLRGFASHIQSFPYPQKTVVSATSPHLSPKQRNSCFRHWKAARREFDLTNTSSWISPWAFSVDHLGQNNYMLRGVIPCLAGCLRSLVLKCQQYFQVTGKFQNPAIYFQMPQRGGAALVNTTELLNLGYFMSVTSTQEEGII